MNFKLMLLILIAGIYTYCDEIDKFAFPFYRNSYKKHQWIAMDGGSYTPNGGMLRKPRKTVHTEIISTEYSFKLFRKLNNSSGIFNVFINGRKQDFYIIIEDMKLVNSASGDVFNLLKGQTIWCIGTFEESDGYMLRRFTPNRQRVIELIKQRSLNEQR